MVKIETLSSAIARVVDAANSHRGREPSQAFRDALALDGPDAEQKRSHVAAALAALISPSGAGFLAVWLGAGVEGGSDPFPQTHSLLDCFLRFTRRVRTDHEDVNEVQGDDELAIGLAPNTHFVLSNARPARWPSPPTWALYEECESGMIFLHGDGLHRDHDSQLLGSAPK